MRRRSTLELLSVIVVGKALAIASVASKENPSALAYPQDPDLVVTQTYTLASGVTGHATHWTGWGQSGGFDWRVKAYSDKNPKTDNKIGARGVGYDRCNPTDAFSLRMDTGWTYAGAGQFSATTPYKYGTYQDCPPTGGGHVYKHTSSHLFTNNNPYLNTTKTFTSLY